MENENKKEAGERRKMRGIQRDQCNSLLREPRDLICVCSLHVDLTNKSLLVSDYKRTSLAKYVKLFDQFLEGMAHSRKGELLKNSGECNLSP